MKFTVEVEEFYLEEESLSTALITQTTQNVVNQIWGSIKDRVEDQITRNVNLSIQSGMNAKINKMIDGIIANECIIVSGKEIQLVDHIKNLFQSNNSWNSPNDAIKSLAKKFGDEMKNRYDLMFASQLVAKMHENNMLKEDVAKLLLENKVK